MSAVPLKSFGGEMDLPSAIGFPVPAKQPRRGGPWHSVTSGRTALALVAQAVSVARRPGPALVPAYICPAVVNTLRMLGLSVRYYPVGADLTVDIGSLVRSVDRLSPALVVVVHYFGFPTSSDVFDALAPHRDRTWVVEDCAHGSWLEDDLAPCGGHGDFVLTSFRKYLPLPDGGWLLNRTGVSLPELPPAETPFVSLRFVAKMLKHEHRTNTLGPAAESAYLDLFARAEHQLDREVPLQSMSATSEALIGQYDLRAIRESRRRNFTRALERIRCAPIAPVAAPLFDRLPTGVSPLVLPLRVARGRRDRLRSALAARSVYCPVHWPLPSDVRARAFESARQLSGDMLGLPIDQRYSVGDIDQLITRVAAACREVA